jgi:beta-lactamase regulating signal transducer with metallopeptidase domain
MTTTSLEAACRHLSQVGLSILLQSAVLLLAGLLVLRLARRAQPAVRSLLGRSLLVGVVLSAVVSLALTNVVPTVWSVEMPAATGQSAPQVLEADDAPGVSAGATGPGAPEALPLARAAESNGIYTAAIALWLGGALVLLARLAWCHAQVLAARRASEPIRSGVMAEVLREECARMQRREPALLRHPAGGGPFLAGVWRPAIVLPQRCEQLFQGETARAVLRHELAHLKRRDVAWNGVAHIACALLWPQPLLWLLRREMEDASEQACDAEVLGGGYAAPAYARCLVELAERLPLSRAERVAAAGVAPVRSSLGRRVQSILSARSSSARVRRRFKLAIGTLTLCAVLCAVGLVGVAAPPLGRAVIVGRVVYADGRPAANLRVDAQIQHGSWSKLKIPYGLISEQVRRVLGASTTTEADGSYRLSGLTTAGYNVAIWNEPDPNTTSMAGPLGWVGAAAEGVRARNGRTVRARDIVLTRGATIEGRVLDRQSGAPLPGLHIGSHGPHRPLSSSGITSAVTDSNGRFFLRVPPGKNYIYSAGPVSNLRAVVQFGSSPRYEKDLHVTRVGDKVYGAGDFVEVTLNGKRTGYSRSSHGGLRDVDSIILKPGQRSRVIFRRTPLKIVPRPSGPPLVILSETPPRS